MPAGNETDLFETIGKAVEALRVSEAPLNHRLKHLADVVKNASPEFGQAVETLIARLRAVECGQGAPVAGDVLPDFMLPDSNGRFVQLKDVLARGPAVISFYRGPWCPYCRLSAETYSHLGDEIGADHMIAITPETRRLNSAFAGSLGLTYPVLTDIDCGYALSLNLAFWVEKSFAELLRSSGTDLGAHNAGIGWVLPIPASFVVDSHGIIVHRHVDPDYRQRMEVYELVAAFKRAT